MSDTGTLGDGIGTATAAYSSSSEASYCVVVKLIGSLTINSVNAWYQANNALAAVITFYNNTGQFVTGGGWILDPAGGGNSKGNFGFNARFNRSGSPQGQMVYVYRGLYNGEPADYRIKSNSLTSLGFACWNGTAYGPCPVGNATFPAKATRLLLSPLTDRKPSGVRGWGPFLEAYNEHDGGRTRVEGRSS